MLRPLLLLTAAAMLVSSGCSPGEDSAGAESTVPTTVVTTTTITTTTSMAPATSTSTMTPTTVDSASTGGWGALPGYVKREGWHLGTYESIGYSCGGRGVPDVECDTPYPANYTGVTVINLGHAGSDSVLLHADFDSGTGQFVAHPVDDRRIAGTGHGIRVEQLDRAPAGLDIGGEAWVRLTVSSLSAMDHAKVHGEWVPTEIGYTIDRSSGGDVLTLLPTEVPPAIWIESVALVATNDTMSEWIITFNQPGTYAYSAYYQPVSNDPQYYILIVRFVPL